MRRGGEQTLAMCSINQQTLSPLDLLYFMETETGRDIACCCFYTRLPWGISLLVGFQRDPLSLLLSKRQIPSVIPLHKQPLLGSKGSTSGWAGSGLCPGGPRQA